jgi:hypothetical protein
LRCTTERFEHAVALDRLDELRQCVGGRVAHVDGVNGDVLHRDARRAVELFDVVGIRSHPKRRRQPFTETSTRIGWRICFVVEGAERVGRGGRGGRGGNEMIAIGHSRTPEAGLLAT